jgi:hypothetical protein
MKVLPAAPELVLELMPPSDTASAIAKSMKGNDEPASFLSRRDE